MTKVLLEQPEYWLGQVAVISRLQREKRLSAEEAMAQVDETLSEMRSVDQRAFLERRRFAEFLNEDKAAILAAVQEPAAI